MEPRFGVERRLWLAWRRLWLARRRLWLACRPRVGERRMWMDRRLLLLPPRVGVRIIRPPFGLLPM